MEIFERLKAVRKAITYFGCSLSMLRARLPIDLVLRLGLWSWRYWRRQLKK